MRLDLPNPPTEKLNPHFILGEIIDHVSELAKDHPLVDIAELRRQLNDVRNHQVDFEKHVRGLLKVFQGTNAYKEAYEQLDDVTKSQISSFARGRPAEDVVKASGAKLTPSRSASKHFARLKYLHSLLHKHLSTAVGIEKKEATSVEKTFQSFPGFPPIYEDAERTKIMEVHSEIPFQNWALNVKNTPLLTFVPTKVLGLQNLVRAAKERGLRIRCSGYRHSWAPIFSEHGEILVSMLNLKQATQLPDPHVLLPNAASNKENDFKVIEFSSGMTGSWARPKRKFVRLGAAVTTEEFRRFCIDNNVTLPMNVILGEVTMAGVNGSICHGGGHRHKTINDQVRSIEYVDANGNHQAVSEPEQLKAAAGCFGLLGIVTHITYEVDELSYAVMQPRKIDVALAIPPLRREDIPMALQKTFTDTQFQNAVHDFERRAAEDYYAQWFWFAYQSTVWVNTWSNVSDATGARDYPSPAETFLQWTQTWLGGIITSTDFFSDLPGRWQAQILATATMSSLPPTTFDAPNPLIKTALPNALHYRRANHNMRVHDMEFNIPIPAHSSSPSPDFSVVRRAWWDVINLVYTAVDSPMRLTLELRIMADSEVVMAPQRGNRWGTASIEILTIPDAVSDEEWKPFMQKVWELWNSYGGEMGRVRPHWGKEWDTLTMDAMPARQYLRNVAYKDAIPEFKSTLADIGHQQGWGLQDLKARFSNKLWDEIVFD